MYRKCCNKAAILVRKEVLKKIEKSCDVTSPPTIESLNDSSRKPPDIVETFFCHLLVGESDHTPNQKKERIIRSFSEDVMYSVSNGNFLTSKHCAVGLGLHSLTGLKQPIVYLSRLGHSTGYDKVEETETAQAELTLKLKEESRNLPLVPKYKQGKVS